MENIENTNQENVKSTVDSSVKDVVSTELKVPTNSSDNLNKEKNTSNQDFNKPKLARVDSTPRSVVDPKDPNKVVFKDPARASNREYNSGTKKPFFNKRNTGAGSFNPGNGANGGGNSFGGGSSKFGGGFGNKPKFGSNGKRDFKKTPDKTELDMFAEVITVRRVTRVVKGGKRMRFAALVVVGDKKGLIGFANKKGMDYQDAVAKATKKAKENLIKVNLTEDHSLSFSTVTKFKSARVLLKPAKAGTSLIAGGYVRPVLELVGIKNVYSKILGSNNKVVGVEAVINALKNYI